MMVRFGLGREGERAADQGVGGFEGDLIHPQCVHGAHELDGFCDDIGHDCTGFLRARRRCGCPWC